MRRALHTKAAAASVVAVTLVGTGITTASAGPLDPTQVTVDLIGDVAPDQGQIAPTTVTGDQAVATTDQTKVSVPLDADQPIAIEDRTGALQAVAGQEATSLEVNLPAEIDTGHGKVATDGTIVYHAAGGGADAAVQVLDDGAVRVQTITPDAQGPHTFTYTFGEGITPILGDDGTVELVQEVSDGIAMTIGTVERPWAADATGATIPTTYQVEGDALVQNIEPTADVVYPIVADPKLTKTWWNTTVYFNRSETNTIAFVSGGIGSVAWKIPEPTISKVVATAAGLSVAYVGWIYNKGSCLKFVYYAHAANVWQPYGGSEAGGVLPMIVALAALLGAATGANAALSRRRGFTWGVNLSVAAQLLALAVLALTQPLGYAFIAMVITSVVSYTLLLTTKGTRTPADGTKAPH